MKKKAFREKYKKSLSNITNTLYGEAIIEKVDAIVEKGKSKKKTKKGAK